MSPIDKHIISLPLLMSTQDYVSFLLSFIQPERSEGKENKTDIAPLPLWRFFIRLHPTTETPMFQKLK